MKLTRTKKGSNTSSNVKKKGILRLLSAPVRYVKHAIESAYEKLVKKRTKKKKDNEVFNEEEFKLRRIKNMGKLKKERLN